MLLTLTGDAAIFFKRNQVNYLKWDYVGENNDIIFLYINLYYNTTIEVKRLIQQWLLYIYFTEKSLDTKKI